MGQSLEEYRLKSKIRESYLRHCGDVIAVSHETGYDLKFIRKFAAKIHKSEDWKNQVIIARNMENLMLSKYNMRFVRFKEMLDALEDKQSKLVSACCSKPMQRIGSSDSFTCMSCNNICNGYEVDVLAIYKLKMEVLSKMAEDDERIQSFMLKMGMTEHPEPLPTIIKNTQNIVVVGKDGKPDIAMQSKLQEIQNMGPMERERLIRGLEEEIIKLTTEIENDETVDVKAESTTKDNVDRR